MSDIAGVALLPSRKHAVEYFGHMWVYWDRELDSPQSYRGYYPDMDDFPDELHGDWDAMAEYVKHNSVKGVMIVDKPAHEIFTVTHPMACYNATWSISPQERLALALECYIPEGETVVERGDYSWNEMRTDWNNCSSWVIKTVNGVVGDSGFLPCKRPKRLNSVIQDIWGAVVPPADRNLR
jgi:hypothetical protein